MFKVIDKYCSNSLRQLGFCTNVLMQVFKIKCKILFYLYAFIIISYVLFLPFNVNFYTQFIKPCFN